MSKMKIIVGFPWVEECLRLDKLLPIENFIPLYATGETGTWYNFYLSKIFILTSWNDQKIIWSIIDFRPKKSLWHCSKWQRTTVISGFDILAVFVPQLTSSHKMFIYNRNMESFCMGCLAKKFQSMTLRRS